MRAYDPGTEEWTLSYFLTDHLGSVVAIADDNATILSEQRYLPFGEVREDVGEITETDLGYTGQRNLDMGLMDYKARFYSAAAMRFIQPDTLVPSPANPQAFNRYSYVNNSPLNFNDPTGHGGCDVEQSNLCGKIKELKHDYGKHDWEDRVSRQWNRTGKLPERPKPVASHISAFYAWKEFLLMAGLMAPGASGLSHSLVPGAMIWGVNGQSSSGEPGPVDPDWRKYLAGCFTLVAGVGTAMIGGLVIGIVIAETVAAAAAAPPTFGLSAVLNILHTPVVFATGGILAAAGAGMMYIGAETMWESGVPSWAYHVGTDWIAESD